VSIEHPEPSPATAKLLYGNAYRCAYKDCRRPLYLVDDQTGNRTLNSRICHIHARRQNGPRWNPSQSPEDNRSEKNLVLMCLEHANKIDAPALVDTHPVEQLLEWKAKQLEEFDRLAQSWTLSPEMAEEVIKASSASEVNISNSRIQLGGEGGRAPGAGGGGGGAIGGNARGGRGGDGGSHRFDEGMYTRPPVEQATIDTPLPVDANTDLPPGAGGGGGGTIGDGARGGDGGGGGEHVSALIDIVALNAAGLDHVEFAVGKGGAAPTLPGQHAPKAEDSIVRFVAKDGTILKEIRASAGSGGKSGSAYLPDNVSELSLEDIRDGFRITTLLPMNSIQLHDGLVFVLGGGWVKCPLQRIPCPVTWPILCMARWSALEKNAARGLYVSLIHPDGHEAACQSMVLSAEETRLNNYIWVRTIGAEFDVAGQWTLRVHSGGFLLAEYSVDVFTGS
jgi:hypothetical protein